jgi:hypothetical protein
MNAIDSMESYVVAEMETDGGVKLLAEMKARGTVLVFGPKFALEDAIGSHTCSFEASMHVTNGISLGCPPPLTGTTVNYIRTLKASRSYLSTT